MKPIHTIAFLSLFIFCASHPAFSQSSSKFAIRQYISKGDTLNYRLLTPDADPLRKFPLIIFLHGSGERGNDNEAQLKWGVSNFATDENMMRYPAFVIAPQCPANLTWSNFSRSDMKLLPTPAKPMETLISLVRESIKTMPIDSNRIYITGLSMGGFGTFDAIERYPNLFAAAVPVCGGGDTSRAASIAHIPIWIFHGAEDPAVNPILSLNMLTALTRAGAHAGFTQYPEVGHFSWLGAYIDKQMIEWMFRQRK
jgi:predicted peptidase